MDFDLRQWLLILGPAVIALVLVHGYLRMRAGQNQIKMKLDKSFLSEAGDETAGVDDLSLLKAELPNGGARVIRADEEVPVLSETVDLPSIRATEQDEAPAVNKEPAARKKTAPPAKAPPARAPAAEKEPAMKQEPAPAANKEPAANKAPAAEKEPVAQQEQPEITEKVVEPGPEKFVVMNVFALEEPFPGQRLLEILVDAGLTFGEMNIFHRLDEHEDPQFSLASAVEPGTFDMATIDQFSTPGVTMFMRVHELRDPIAVLDEMLSLTEAIATELGGEVLDETRSIMTPQTIEHCRQSIRDFQFKHSA